jgi:hypothetical protein
MKLTTPEDWIPVDDDTAEYISETLDDRCVNRYTIIETDDGWAIEVTVAVSSGAVSRIWLLPASVQNAAAELHEECERVLVWESGIGVQVET